MVVTSEKSLDIKKERKYEQKNSDSLEQKKPGIINESKTKTLRDKIVQYDNRVNFSIYLGTGLYQICVGLFLGLLVSFILGVPTILLYPYVTPVVLWIIKIFGWVLVFFGTITGLYPFMKSKIAPESSIHSLFVRLLKISAIFSFILVPIGLFLGSALRSEIRRELNLIKTEKSLARTYFLLLFLTGLIHVLIGAFLVFFFRSIIADVFDLAFPYITYETINFLVTLGWICLIPGSILIVCSFWSKKFSEIEDITCEKYLLKAIRALILGASAFITLVFPIGTFLGLSIIQEFYAMKSNNPEMK